MKQCFIYNKYKEGHICYLEQRLNEAQLTSSGKDIGDYIIAINMNLEIFLHVISLKKHLHPVQQLYVFQENSVIKDSTN